MLKMEERPWYCVRQRAGPLVKECRAIRPRLSKDDNWADRREKQEIIHSPHSAVCRTQADRLELRLALFWYEGLHHTLTYDSTHLPPDFKAVRATLRAFMGRARRFNEGDPFDWIYCIEGLHGDHRYHIHMVLRDSDFPPAVVRHLWTAGDAWDEPVLMPTGGYRRLAEYFNKERTDGVWIPIGRHPWSCSRSLSHQLPPAERWRDSSGVVDIPDKVLWARRGQQENSFGAYNYASYIEQKERVSFFNMSRARTHAHVRASILKSSGKIDTFERIGGEPLAKNM